MRYLLAFTCALIALILLTATPATAAALACMPDAFRQPDMAGVYVSPESRMRVEMYPCGGTYIQWDNPYGTHSGVYAAAASLSGGGVAAQILLGERLDGAFTIGLKPAEPGFIQVITLGPYGDSISVYRLRKLG